jgi:hypothetical protein
VIRIINPYTEIRPTSNIIIFFLDIVVIILTKVGNVRLPVIIWNDHIDITTQHIKHGIAGCN